MVNYRNQEQTGTHNEDIQRTARGCI
jgi:hypothetical protein